MSKIQRSGLLFRRWVHFLDDFVRQNGQHTPRWAILCTYECDIGLIERDVVPKLTRRGRSFRTIVLADAGALQRHLRSVALPLTRVNVHPVRLRGSGVFHTKLLLLRAGDHVLVCTGSANLTSGGFGSNLELWAASEDRSIVAGVVSFLHDLVESNHIYVDSAAKSAIRRAVVGLENRPSPRVWTSLREPFSERLSSRDAGLKGAIGVSIISPAYAAPGGLSAALKSFPAKRTAIFTDRPVNAKGAAVWQFDPFIGQRQRDQEDDAIQHEDTQDDEGPRLPLELHAKAFVFDRRNGKSILWLGSANLTATALRRSASKNGNVEMLVRTDMSQDEREALGKDLQRFFSRNGNNLKPGPFRSDPRPTAKGRVLCGELQKSGSGLLLHTVPGTASLVVRIGQGGRDRSVPIDKKGVGLLRLTNKDLEIIQLADFSESEGWIATAYEVVGKELIPIIINVPHVPSTGRQASGTEEEMDRWLDDFLGRWPRLRSKEKAHADANGMTPENSFEAEWERKLDEAKHQGILDRLAVKGALLKKRIESLKAGSNYRTNMREAVAASLLESVDPHLRQIVARWFGVKARRCK